MLPGIISTTRQYAVCPFLSVRMTGIHQQAVVHGMAGYDGDRAWRNVSTTTIASCILHLSAEEIAQIYRYRWDLEMFFRFIKQELNFSHFLSLDENGLQVILYMTMITAMLVMIYKNENEIGYKTAKRRMGIEIENLVLAIVVIQSAGDLRKTDLPAP